MSRMSVLIGAVLTCFLVACEGSPTPKFDPELPEPAGLKIALGGEKSAPLIATDSPMFLTFHTDKRFFHGVADALHLRDNSIATVNQFTSEIFIFDSTGNFVRSIGRQGSGPGEFHDANSLISLGPDTIVAFDRQARKVSLFTTDGDFVDEYRITGPSGASPIGHAELVGALDQQRLLIWSQAMPTEEDLNLPPNQPAAIPVVPFSVDVSGKSSVMIGKFPGLDQWISDASGMEVNYGPAPFGGRTWFGTMRGKAVVLRNTEPAFRVLLPDGSAHAVYQGTWRAREVTPQDRNEFMANWFTRLRKESYWKKLESLTEQAFPTTTPYYRDAMIGTDGIVWIEPYESCCGDERLYFGYDSTGIAVGKLMLPARDRLLEIGDGVLIAARVEDLGTVSVYVQRYRLGPGQKHATSTRSSQQWR